MGPSKPDCTCPRSGMASLKPGERERGSWNARLAAERRTWSSFTERSVQARFSTKAPEGFLFTTPSAWASYSVVLERDWLKQLMV